MDQYARNPRSKPDETYHRSNPQGYPGYGHDPHLPYGTHQHTNFRESDRGEMPSLESNQAEYLPNNRIYNQKPYYSPAVPAKAPLSLTPHTNPPMTNFSSQIGSNQQNVTLIWKKDFGKDVFSITYIDNSGVSATLNKLTDLSKCYGATIVLSVGCHFGQIDIMEELLETIEFVVEPFQGRKQQILLNLKKPNISKKSNTPATQPVEHPFKNSAMKSALPDNSNVHVTDLRETIKQLELKNQILKEETFRLDEELVKKIIELTEREKARGQLDQHKRENERVEGDDFQVANENKKLLVQLEESREEILRLNLLIVQSEKEKRSIIQDKNLEIANLKEEHQQNLIFQKQLTNPQQDFQRTDELGLHPAFKNSNQTTVVSTLSSGELSKHLATATLPDPENLSDISRQEKSKPADVPNSNATDPDIYTENARAVTPVLKTENARAVTPVKETENARAVTPVKETENARAVTPVLKTGNARAVTPVLKTDNARAVTPVLKTENARAVTPVKGTENDRAVTPVKETENARAVTPVKETENARAVTPVLKTDNARAVTPVLKTENARAVTPVKGTENDRAVTPVKETENARAVTPVKETENDRAVTPVKETENARAVTPVKETENARAVTPVQEMKKDRTNMLPVSETGNPESCTNPITDKMEAIAVPKEGRNSLESEVNAKDTEIVAEKTSSIKRNIITETKNITVAPLEGKKSPKRYAEPVKFNQRAEGDYLKSKVALKKVSSSGFKTQVGGVEVYLQKISSIPNSKLEDFKGEEVYCRPKGRKSYECGILRAVFKSKTGFGMNAYEETYGGIEFKEAVGDCDGIFGKRYFHTPPGCATFVAHIDIKIKMGEVEHTHL